MALKSMKSLRQPRLRSNLTRRSFLLSAALLLSGCAAAPEQGSESVDDIPILYDSPREILYEFPPYYSQYDERWANVAYATNTIGESGCGLCAAASALSFVEQKEYTPADLHVLVGSSCTVNGVNDMSLFLAYFEEAFSVEHSDIYWMAKDAYQALTDGLLVFAGVNGTIGNQSYDGHIVLMWKQYGHINVMDSASETLGGLTDDEFYQASFLYFYFMKGPVDVTFYN